jgi:hypothetical protein
MQDEDLTCAKPATRFAPPMVVLLAHEIEFVFTCLSLMLEQKQFEEATQLLHECIGRARLLQQLCGLQGTLEVDSLAQVTTILIGNFEYLREYQLYHARITRARP